MKPKSWHLLHSAILGSCALGVAIAALLDIALFIWPHPNTLGGLFFALCLGLFAGLSHGLVVAAGGLLVWGVVVLIAAVESRGTSGVITPLVISVAIAALLTAGSARITLLRSSRNAYGHQPRVSSESGR